MLIVNIFLLYESNAVSRIIRIILYLPNKHIISAKGFKGVLTTF